LSVVLLSVACCVFGQLSAGGNWDGTWSNGKLGAGNLYICTDRETNTAHGSYGNIGLISGYLLGNTFKGFWYEAGYDKPFGPFTLTIADSGSSFTGSWSYYGGNTTNTWSGSKSSGVRPNEHTQCLFPAAQGSIVQGVFDERSYICDHSTVNWLDSEQPLYVASFEGFPKVQGYSPDSGNSLLLSDFYFPDDEDDRSKFNPSNTPIGQAYENVADNHGADDDDSVLTSHIVVGRFVAQDTFCGWFWYGFYSQVINTVPICFGRTENVAIDPQACAYTQSDIKQQAHNYDDGNTSQLIQNIQDAFDALELPNFYIDVVEGDNNGGNQAAKDVNDVQYIQEQPCTASGIFVSVAALLALFFAF